jgi:hypothetical protein
LRLSSSASRNIRFIRFWGDRPSIRQVLAMVGSGNYSFDAPKRLKLDHGK